MSLSKGLALDQVDITGATLGHLAKVGASAAVFGTHALQAAYDQGASILAAAGGPVAITGTTGTTSGLSVTMQLAASGAAIVATNNAVNNADAVTVTKNPAGAQSGAGVAITMGVNTTGVGLSVTQSGSGLAATFNAPISATGVYIPERVGDLTNVANTGGLYTKDSGGNTELFYIASDGTVTQLTPAAGGGTTLGGAYNFGGAGAGRGITADAGAVTISSVNADNNNILELTKNPAGAQSGVGLSVTMGATTTGNGITVTMTAGAGGLALLASGGSISSPGAGANSERYGSGATAAGAQSASFGKNAAAAGTGSVSFGNGASTFGNFSVSIGGSAVSLAGTGQVVIGFTSEVSLGSGNNNVVIGTACFALGTDGVSIGDSTVTDGTDAVAIGDGAQAGAAGLNTMIAIGPSDASSATQSIAIGRATAAHTQTMMFGAGVSTAANQAIFGHTLWPINNVWFGRGPAAAAPSTYTINGTGGTGAAVAGADIYIAGGTSGDAATAGGGVKLQFVQAGTGTSLTDGITLSNTGAITVGCTTAASDVAPGSVTVMAQHALAQAAGNKTGAATILAAGLGPRTVTILDYTLLAGKAISLVVNATQTTKTEGVNWTAAVSNGATATSLATALSAISGISATAVGSTVYLTLASTVYAIDGDTGDTLGTGFVFSGDIFLGQNGISPAQYTGGSLDGAVILGGAGLTKLSTATSQITAGSLGALTSPAGFLKVMCSTYSAPTIHPQMAGVQVWPADYGTYTDLSYESLVMGTFDSGGVPNSGGLVAAEGAYLLSTAYGAGREVQSLTIGTTAGEQGAGATAGDLWLMTAASNRWQVAAATGHLLPGATNTYNLGSSSFKLKDGYFAGDVSIGGKLTVTGAIDPTSLALSGGTALYIESADGSTATTAPANKGRLRYLDGTGWQASSSTGSWTTLAVGATGVTLDQAYDFGGAGSGRAITADADAVTISSTAADNNNLLELAKNPAGAQSGKGLLITMGATTTGAGIDVTMTAGASGAAILVATANAIAPSGGTTLLLGNSANPVATLTLGNGSTAASPQAVTMSTTSASSATVTGSAFTIKAGNGNTTGLGGALTLKGGAGGATAATGGAVEIDGGLSGSAAGTGGSIVFKVAKPATGTTLTTIATFTANATLDVSFPGNVICSTTGGTISCSNGNIGNEMFGASATAAGGNSCSFGNTASSGGADAVAMGMTSTAGGTDSIAIGSHASTSFGGGTHTGSIAIGRTAYCAANCDYSVAIGYQSVCTAAHQFNIGDATGYITSYNFGDGITASTAPHATTFVLASPISAANGVGVSATLQAGASKGSGAGGSIIFQTTPAGAGGGGQNSYSTVLTLDSTLLSTFSGALALTGAAAKNYLELNDGTGVAVSGANKGRIRYLDGTGWQVSSNTGTFTTLATGATVYSNPGAGANSEGFGASVATAGSASAAFGKSASSSATNTSAFGNSAVASVADSTAIGKGATVSSTGGGTALGSGATCTGTGGGATNGGFISIGLGIVNAAVPGNWGASIAIGSALGAGNYDSLIIGSACACDALGTAQIVIGTKATTATTATVSILIGANSTLTSSQSVLIGSQAAISGGDTTGVGHGLSITGARGVAIGKSSGATAADATAIGQSASASGANNVAIGSGSTASGTPNIVIGKSSTTAGFARTFVVGTSATATANNQAVFGHSGHELNDIYFGTGVTDSSPATVTINGCGTATAATTGGSITVKGGLGNTSGAGGLAALLGGTPGSTGTGGAATVTGGAGVAAVGGAASITGGAGVGTDKASGGVTVSTGNSSGSGASTLALAVAPTQGTGSGTNTAVTFLAIVGNSIQNGSQLTYGCIRASTTLDTGSTTTNTAVVPAHSYVLGVVTRVTTTITTAVNYAVKDNAGTNVFIAATTNITSGSTATGIVYSTSTYYDSANTFTIVTNANPGAGVVEVIIYYCTLTPPTS